MRKRLLALACAALLAFGAPAAAFGVTIGGNTGDWVINGSDATVSVPKVVLSNGSITNIAISMKGADGSPVKDVVKQLTIDSVSTPAWAASMKPVLSSACEITFYGADGVKLGLAGQRGGTISFDFQFDWNALSALPASIDKDNLRVSIYATHTGESSTEVLIKDAPALGPVSGQMDARSCQLVMVLTDSTPISGFSGSDDDDTPDVIYQDGERIWRVSGTTSVSAWGNLGGANLPAGADVSISAETLTSGSVFDQLRAAMGGGTFLGAFEVNLSVNGAIIHDEFGRLHLGFTVGYQYEGRTVTVWHRHNDGSLTSEVTRVNNGQAQVVVDDLSAFAVELGGFDSGSEATVKDASLTSPKTGQAGATAAPAALAAVVALGAGAAANARRRMAK